MATFAPKQRPPASRASTGPIQSRAPMARSSFVQNPAGEFQPVARNPKRRSNLSDALEEQSFTPKVGFDKPFDSSSFSRLDFTRIPIRTLSAPAMQAKLIVNQPGDEYEQEADRVAEQVMRMPADASPGPVKASVAPFVQRQCSCGGRCEKCKKHSNEESRLGKKLQRKASDAVSSSPGFAPPIVSQVLGSPGQPLDAATRAFMEPRFGYDFSGVRVHSDASANDSASAVHANAYTVGNDVVFGRGKFIPGTPEGGRLLAHELTHVVQQTNSSLGGQAIASRLQRDSGPDWNDDFFKTTKAIPTGGPNYMQDLSASKPDDAWNATAPDDALYFPEFEVQGGTGTCQKQSCHQERKQPSFNPPRKRRKVTDKNILIWAKEQISSKHVHDRTVQSLLLRREDAKLHEVWNRDRGILVARIQSALDFIGPDSARSTFASYLQDNWKNVEKSSDEEANARLVQEIQEALHSGKIPLGSKLVTEPKVVDMVENHPIQGKIEIGRDWVHDTVTVGYEGAGIRMKSVNGSDLIFEVIGHEGIYFQIWQSDYNKTDPELSKGAEVVAKNTRGTALMGEAVKGFLSTLASPILIAAETGARVVDMATQGAAVLGAWTSWYDVGYTCWSSTCKQYEQCVNTAEDTEKCSNDALVQAVKEATIILPVVEQGQQCIDGNAEACGGIAAMALGLAHEGLEKLEPELKEPTGGAQGPRRSGKQTGKVGSTSDIEEVAIREAIDRPLEGDPKLAEPTQKPKAHESQAPHHDTKASNVGPHATVAEIAEETARETVVDGTARAYGSEFDLSDGKHGVAPYGKGSRRAFHVCSNACGWAADKLAEFQKVLPKGSKLARDVEFLRKQVEGYDLELRKPKRSGPGQFNEARASVLVKNELQQLARSNPTLSRMMEMTTEELKANRAALKKELAGSPKFVDEAQTPKAAVGRVPPEKMPVLKEYTSRKATNRGANYQIKGDKAAFDASRKSGFQVYEYRNAKGELLYTGKSGGALEAKANWIDRLQDSHINTDWINDAKRVTVYFDLTEQEMWALEEVEIPTSVHKDANVKAGDYSTKFKGGNLGANAAAALKRPKAVFAIDAVQTRSL